MKLLSISDTKNIDTFRKRINSALESVSAGYGSALPSALPVDDGKLFVVSGTIYQNQNGAWVAL